MPLRRTLILAAALTALAAAGQNITSAEQLASVAPTLSLGEPIRTAKLESDDPEIKYQNGFFFDSDGTGHILIRDKDGHTTGDFNLRPQQKDAATTLRHVHDAAVYKDGSIVASWIYMLPHDEHRYHYLVHYDSQGNFLESIDLGQWRAIKICIADDKSIWTLSGKDEFGFEVYSPDEGVVRNYKFGSGFLRAGVPRSTFPHNDGQYSYATKNGRASIDCSEAKVHVLTGLDQWIEYTPDADFTITNIEPFSRSTFGDYWRMIGFAYLYPNHAYAVIHSIPGDPVRRMLAELLPSEDGKSLRWVEVGPDKTLPASNRLPDPATSPAERPKDPVAVTGLLGVDHDDGEKLVYRTSKDATILWSKPLFGSHDGH